MPGETTYQSIFVQGRGELRRELASSLRSGRALSRGDRGGDQDAVVISERPAEASDQAVPGNWEGDLILGRDGTSAIGTLVERSTRYCLLLRLPRRRRDAATVAEAMTQAIQGLPDHLHQSLTQSGLKPRPRDALGFYTPAEALSELLSA
jgi:transposase, IS30 family